MAERAVIFFDLGDTVVVPEISGGALRRLVVLPFAKQVLTALREPTVTRADRRRLGIISNTGNETGERMRALLQEAGLWELFDPQLLLFSSVEGIDKSQPAIFTRAAERAGVPPRRCVFVGESEKEREVARSAQLAVSFHPLHAFHVVAQVEQGP